MATVRAGSRAALLVVDVQVGVVRDAWDVVRIVQNVARVVERARAHRVPVVWVQHAGEELPHGSPEWQWVPELVPAQGELLLEKHYNSAFEDTPLEQELAQIGASHVVLAGASTGWCIRATAYGALDRGYDLTLVKDAHTTDTIELRDGTKLEAEDVIRDLNVVMAFVTYPGRVSRALRADEIDFGALG